MSDKASAKAVSGGRKWLASATKSHIETIRYYERAGLMPPPKRAANGYRVYGEGDVRRLGFVLKARRLGFSLSETRELLSLVDGGRATCAEVRATTQDHLEAVRERITDLRRLERTLADVSSRCSGEAVPACPIIDALMDERELIA